MTALLWAPPGVVRSPHGAATTVLLHLAPGVIGLLAFVGLIPLVGALGLPSVAALAGVGLFVIPAIQLGVLQVHSRRWPSDPAVALRDRLPLPRLLGWAILEIALAGAVFALMEPLKQLIQTRMFGWWPDTWTIRLGTDGQYSDGALLFTAALILLGTVLVAPLVEELYFRGFLLPRMPQRLGAWQIPAHVALFAGHHLCSPWLTPTRVLAILPLAYIALRTRDVRIGMVAHVVLNATDLVVLLLFIGMR